MFRAAGQGFRTLSRRVFIFALVLGLNGTASAADIFIDDFRLIVDDTPEPPLERTAHGAATFALSFARDVGGVNFQTAVRGNARDSALKGPISLVYDESASDGQRLRVTVGGRSLVASPLLYDWQLKPIVAYADSPYTALVSLFGAGPQRQNYFYIRYHPAFQNTLLGLRLLQADMFLMNPLKLRALPQSEGREIVGRGETTPSEADSLSAATRIKDLISSKPRGSWILTDVDVAVLMNFTPENTFKLSGTPYYFFWHSEPTTQQMQTMLRTWTQRNPAASSAEIRAEAERIKNIDRKLVEDSSYTASLKDKFSWYIEANQAVFSSSLNVMQYAALFRSIKSADPVAWRQFVSQTKASSNADRVPTPTRLVRR